jgi:hypothetical protein
MLPTKSMDYNNLWTSIAFFAKNKEFPTIKWLRMHQKASAVINVALLPSQHATNSGEY